MPFLRRTLLAGAVAALGFLTPWSSLTSILAQEDAGDAVLGHRIAKGIVFDGRLWLRGMNILAKAGPGGLVSISLSDGSKETYFQHGVVDVAKSAGTIWTLRQVSDGNREFALSEWMNGSFEEVAYFSLHGGDDPLLLKDISGAPAVISSKSVRILAANRRDWRVVKLNDALRLGVQESAAVTGNGGSLYVGANRGEWGGGLQSVNLETGVVTNIERRDTKELCSGPLNSECDPVTGVVADARDPDCVFAAVGLLHMWRSTGRILKVCGKKVELVAEQPMKGGFDGKEEMTEAFYGIVPADGGAFWGITQRAVYRFAADGKQDGSYPLPAMQMLSGFAISRELPGLIVLRTDINWAVSTSGYTPLLVPLENSETQVNSNSGAA